MAFYQTNNSPYKSYYDIVYYENVNWSSHLHDNFELVLLLDGELAVYDEEKIYRLKAGDAILLFPNHIHSFEKDNKSICYICSFSTDYVPAFMNKIKDKTVMDAVFRPNSELFNFLIFQFKRKFTLSSLEVKALSYLICSSFLQQVKLLDQKNANSDLLHKILKYILDNYTLDISLKNLANSLGYEEHYVSRCFHKYFPFNFKDYVNQLRINKAKELLQGTNLSITEIATTCGFNSIRNFNRAFLKETGDTPKNYRKNLR